MALTRKRSRDTLDATFTAFQSFDNQEYCEEVLELAPSETEDDIDERLAHEAAELEISLPAQNIDKLASSISTVTIDSDPALQSLETSHLSRSTASTSCSSSEHRPFTQSSYLSEAGTSPPQSPSILSMSSDKKSRRSFRGGILKMTGFKRRRSSGAPSITSFSEVIGESAPPSVNASKIAVHKSCQAEPRSERLMPPQGQDLSLPWRRSTPLPSVTQLVYGDGVSSSTNVDADAVKRTRECKEIQTLVSKQVDERSRFIDYWSKSIKQIQSQHDTEKRRLRTGHAAEIQKLKEANETAVDQLEHRQLQAELDLIADLEAQKQACLLRLRHMEAYCRSTRSSVSPDASPISTTGPRGSTTSAASSQTTQNSDFPYHEVTDRDYNTLAAQYRERDAMDSLHRSKIEVLRGKQERQLRNFVTKKEDEVEATMRAKEEELNTLGMARKKAIETLAQALNEKRSRLQIRWSVERSIEVTKMELKTGKSFAPLKDIEIDLHFLPQGDGSATSLAD
ncbi:MAG: hypothetical protein Q9227_009224 [Pyrenula ochraceoflavens]